MFLLVCLCILRVVHHHHTRTLRINCVVLQGGGRTATQSWACPCARVTCVCSVRHVCVCVCVCVLSRVPSLCLPCRPPRPVARPWQLTELASSSHLQKELTGQAASAAAAQNTALFGERAALQEEVGTWREKHVLAMGQLRKAKTMLAVTSVECAALKEQRESARAELAATLAARKKASAEKARASKAAAQAEAKEAKRLETARKQRDLQQRINENKSAFHDSQLAASMAAKVQQITALNLQISSLQSELEAQKQLASGLQSEVTSSKELLAASQSKLEQTVAKAAESDAALEQAMASLATAQQSASSAEELLKSESNKAAAAEKSLKQQVGSLTVRISAVSEARFHRLRGPS
jgi:predicted  nucleic acid-binding Zn-ribbon protein